MPIFLIYKITNCLTIISSIKMDNCLSSIYIGYIEFSISNGYLLTSPCTNQDRITTNKKIDIKELHISNKKLTIYP
jgi:hypothetical protein